MKKRPSLLWDVQPFSDKKMQIASPQDFAFKSFSILREKTWDESQVIPYCFNFSTKEILYTDGVDPIFAADATFHYEFLRENSNRIISMPWEERLQKKIDFSDPIFIFSPGRCGSTLLTKLISALGAVSVSEPDIYAQIAIFSSRCSSADIYDGDLSRILSCTTADLVKPLLGMNNDSVVLKMRLEANNNPGLILSCCSSYPKTIFLIRDFCSWAESFLRISNLNLDTLFQIYLGSLDCYSFLRQNSNCLLVKYENLEKQDMASIDEISNFLDLSKKPRPDGIDMTLCTNSQQGTYIDLIRSKSYVDSQAREQIQFFWKTNQPKVLLNSLGLDFLIL
jgi:hypothetical protein